MRIHGTRTQIQKVILYSNVLNVSFKDFWHTKKIDSDLVWQIQLISIPNLRQNIYYLIVFAKKKFWELDWYVSSYLSSYTKIFKIDEWYFQIELVKWIKNMQNFVKSDSFALLISKKITKIGFEWFEM